MQVHPVKAFRCAIPGAIAGAFDSLNQLPLVFARLAVALRAPVIFMEEVIGARVHLPELQRILKAYCVQVKVPWQFEWPTNQPHVSAAEALAAPPKPAMGKRVDGRALAKVKELERSGERNFGGKYNVMDTRKPACTITTQPHPSTGCFTIRRGA